MFNKKLRPWDQSESMATRYMNRFAIEEDDQFEIDVNHYKDKTLIDESEICEIIEKLIYKAKKGSFDINSRYVAYRMRSKAADVESKWPVLEAKRQI